MKKIKRLTAIMFATLFTLNTSAEACTDIRITAKDGTVLVARSLEFGLDFHSNIRTSPRDRLFTMTTPNNKPGLSWKAKYGYVFLDGLNTDVATDGMNEAGLSFEELYLPGYAGYQTVPAGQESKGLSYIRFGDWVLSNFKTVDEVKQALSGVYVYAEKIPGQGDMIFPLHFGVHDASGKSIVIEYVDGKMSVYDNKIGVFTNSPTYDWHLKNLLNYLHLMPVNPPAVVDHGVKFAVTGQGFGMIGLPGDISPPSRFVKAAVLTRVALPVDNAAGALNLAEHVMNNFDIPLGLAREPDQGNQPTNELTQWVVFKDLTHKVFYYRTYDNLTLRSVSLSQLNFAPGAERLKMPIASKPFVQDMTGQLLKSVDVPAAAAINANKG